MTRDEAISIIEERIRVAESIESSYVDCVDIEALRIAIKAPEQPESKNGKWIDIPTERNWHITKVVDISSDSIEAIADAVVKKMKGDDELPSAQPEQQWIPVTKDQILQAGHEGREVRFYIGGRLFAIRELAQ